MFRLAHHAAYGNTVGSLKLRTCAADTSCGELNFAVAHFIRGKPSSRRFEVLRGKPRRKSRRDERVRAASRLSLPDNRGSLSNVNAERLQLT